MGYLSFRWKRPLEDSSSPHPLNNQTNRLVVFLLGNLFISILFDEEKVKKISIISIIICMVFAMLFLLVGIFLVSEIKSSVGNEFSKPDYTNMYGSVKILTLSYIPIIIQVVLIFALFMFNAISKTDIFNKPKKNKLFKYK